MAYCPLQVPLRWSRRIELGGYSRQSVKVLIHIQRGRSEWVHQFVSLYLDLHTLRGQTDFSSILNDGLISPLYRHLSVKVRVSTIHFLSPRCAYTTHEYEQTYRSHKTGYSYHFLIHTLPPFLQMFLVIH